MARNAAAGDLGGYSAFVRRILTAYGRKVASADPEDLPALAATRAALDEAIHQAITGQRAAGRSWESIGAAMGMTAQGASQSHKRYAARQQA